MYRDFDENGMEGSWETETVVEGFKEEFKAQQETNEKNLTVLEWIEARFSNSVCASTDVSLEITQLSC